MKSKFRSVLPVAAALLLTSFPAYASEGSGQIGLGAGLAIALAALGAGIGQGLSGNGALSAIGRNPQAAAKIQTPMIIALAFTEALALFAFAIAYLLYTKV